jgi:hypothetical protein
MPDLALDFQSDDQEEDRHQELVHPEVERLVDRPAPEADGEARVPQVVVGVAPRRVGPGQRHGCGGEQEQAARGLHFEEALDWRGDPLRHSADGQPLRGPLRERI